MPNPNPNTSGLKRGRPKLEGRTTRDVALSLHTDVLALVDSVASKREGSRSSLVSMLLLDGLERAGHLHAWGPADAMVARLALVEGRRISPELMGLIAQE